MIRTRFAPSPTGFLHIGGARTALFAWAYARHYSGQFILRIEDTDVARSTPEAVEVILDGMRWLGLDFDEGPFYQTQRMDRYRAVIQQMLGSGSAYPCYMTSAELDRLREEQRATGMKPRYDGRWRPGTGKVLPPPPSGVQPVIRFCNPEDGVDRQQVVASAADELGAMAGVIQHGTVGPGRLTREAGDGQFHVALAQVGLEFDGEAEVAQRPRHQPRVVDRVGELVLGAVGAVADDERKTSLGPDIGGAQHQPRDEDNQEGSGTHDRSKARRRRPQTAPG